MKKNIEWTAWLCVIIGAIFFLVYIGGLLSNNYFILGEIGDKDIERTGQIGDFFGGVIGSFWALAGVLLYFSALKMQSKELSNQVYEINETKKLASQQQLETTFFTLLNTQQDIRNNIKGSFCTIEQNRMCYQKTNLSFSSSDYFSRAVVELKNIYAVYKRTQYSGWDEEQVLCELEAFYSVPEDEALSGNNGDISRLYRSFNLVFLTSYYRVKEETVKMAQGAATEELMCQCVYGHLFTRHQNALGHYCRHLYNIVKFIDREKKACLDEINMRFPIDNQEKQKEKDKADIRFDGYISFVHSVLSTAELCVLFYNALLFPNAKELYVRYHLFDNLLQENLIKKGHAELMEGATLKTSGDLFSLIIEKIRGVQIEE